MDNLYNNYIYSIAQGRTLAYINALKEGARDALAEIGAIASNVGATVEMNNQPSFIFNHGAAVPQGWKDPGQCQYTHTPPLPPCYEPDPSTPEGLAVEQAIRAALNKLNLSRKFNQACHEAAPSTHHNAYEFSFEELGGLTIVKSPRACASPGATERVYYLPPDCQQISFAAYTALKLSTMKEPAREIRPFANDFK